MQQVAAVLNTIVRRIGKLWNRGCLGKAIVGFLALLLIGICTAPFRGAAPTARQPTAAPAAQLVAAPTEPPAPTAAPQSTRTPKPSATPEPTATPQPTATDLPTAGPPTPRTTDPAGVPPLNKDDCPPEYPIKGNIGDNGKIYHVPGSRSYSQTDPERCFALSADAEAAGFRAPNN